MVARIAQGDERAAEMLVRRHFTRIYNLARRTLNDAAEAEDVAQETFLRLWKHAKSWRPEGAKFETWLARIALNLCFDRLRKRREITGDEMPELADEALTAPELLIAADRAQIVQEAMAALPARQRAAISLCHYQEMSNIDAAIVLGVSVEALESLLSRGRRALRAALASEARELGLIRPNAAGAQI